MEPIMKELFSYYFHQPADQIEPVPFGITNFSQIWTVNKKKYVARVYNIHSKSLERLKLEIELTAHLERCQLPFKVPEFLQASHGECYIELSSGQLGTVVHFIEGEVPNLKQPSEVVIYGRTVGELSRALSHFKSMTATQELNFHRLHSVHPLANERAIGRFLEQPPFELELDHLSVIKEAFHEVLRNAPLFESLPKQMIHHDLLIFNLLIDREGGKMNGVLDFDYASNDIRALELAIAINHLLQQNDNSWMHMDLFLAEYAKFMALTEEEIRSIPMLMRMYDVSLLSIYIGQHCSGRDITDYFRFIGHQLVIRTEWLAENEQELIARLNQVITKPLNSKINN